MDNRIYLSPPQMTGEEIINIKDAIDSNWVAPVGPHVDGFEKELATTLGIDDAVVVNSGTAAIHLGLLALGVKPGDEVICPTLTFCATANPVIYCGASPVFVDSEPDTWNVDPVLLELAINDRLEKTGKKPRVIIVVHLYGMPARMNEILAISRKYEIPVLEDAAEALGSAYDNIPLGTLGEVGVLSFNGNKIITTSGGGALISKNAEMLQRARYLRQEAKEPLPYYEHKEIGYNYRLSNISAAIGRAQLKDLKNRVSKRRAIYEMYWLYLSKMPGIRFQTEPMGHFSNRWLSVILMDVNKDVTNESLRNYLDTLNIESRLAWKPLHLQPVYKKYVRYGGEIAAEVFTRGLCLPSGNGMTDADLNRIKQALNDRLRPN